MKKIVITEGPVQVGDVTLLAVVKVISNGRAGKRTMWYFGMKIPIAVVIASGSSRRVFRIDGEEITLEQLLEENPGIGPSINV